MWDQLVDEGCLGERVTVVVVTVRSPVYEDVDPGRNDPGLDGRIEVPRHPDASSLGARQSTVQVIDHRIAPLRIGFVVIAGRQIDDVPDIGAHDAADEGAVCQPGMRVVGEWRDPRMLLGVDAGRAAGDRCHHGEESHGEGAQMIIHCRCLMQPMGERWKCGVRRRLAPAKI